MSRDCGFTLPSRGSGPLPENPDLSSICTVSATSVNDDTAVIDRQQSLSRTMPEAGSKFINKLPYCFYRSSFDLGVRRGSGLREGVLFRVRMLVTALHGS